MFESYKNFQFPKRNLFFFASFTSTKRATWTYPKLLFVRFSQKFSIPLTENVYCKEIVKDMCEDKINNFPRNTLYQVLSNLCIYTYSIYAFASKKGSNNHRMMITQLGSFVIQSSKKNKENCWQWNLLLLINLYPLILLRGKFTNFKILNDERVSYITTKKHKNKFRKREKLINFGSFLPLLVCRTRL